MKSTKLTKLLFLSLASFGLIGAATVASGYTGQLFTNAETETFKMTIDKNSTCDGITYSKGTLNGTEKDIPSGKVHATTAKGNDCVFSYQAFDCRPGTADWDNLVCFHQGVDGLGGYITNDNAIYGVKSIKIYGYSLSDPTPSTLTSQVFNVYYGYESIIVDHSNSARVQTVDGAYTFASGYEPSYIAIENVNGFDVCISKVEIEFLCEEVQGTITSHDTAYKYDAKGKIFTTSNGTEIPYNVTESAPWVHADLTGFTLYQATSAANAGYASSVTFDENGATLKGYYNSCMYLNTIDSSSSRPIISVTMKLGQWEWGGPSIYFKIKKASGEISYQLYNGGLDNWTGAGGKIYNSDGTEVTSINATDFFTFEMDTTVLTNKAGTLAYTGDVTFVYITSGWNSADENYANVDKTITTVKDITFKETYCGHKSSCIEERNILTEATCATSVVKYCTECNKVVSTVSTTFKDGYTKQDTSTVNGVRGTSSVYDKTSGIINNTCTNQFGPMFAVGTDVDQICFELEVLSAEDISTATFFFYLSEADKDISWSSRYAYDVTSTSSTSITSPSNDTVCYELTDSQGESITSWDVGDTIVLKIDLAAVRTLGFSPVMLLLGTKNTTAVKINSLVYHTATAE